MNIALGPYLQFPHMEPEEAEIVALLKESEAWRATKKYLERCLGYTTDELGKTENPRDKDMVLKGAKGTLEHFINLPLIANERLEVPSAEVEMPSLDDRLTLELEKEEEPNET
jgi:hypothetical protein